MVYSAVLAAQTVLGLSPGHVCECVDRIGLAVIVTYIQSAVVAHNPETMQKGSTLAVKPRTDVTRSTK